MLIHEAVFLSKFIRPLLAAQELMTGLRLKICYPTAKIFLNSLITLEKIEDK